LQPKRRNHNVKSSASRESARITSLARLHAQAAEAKKVSRNSGHPARQERQSADLEPREILQLLPLFRQIGWLLTASNLPSKLRTLWRLIAREMTEPKFASSKRPRKAKAPRPF
jgi:hypothetical protein